MPGLADSLVTADQDYGKLKGMIYGESGAGKTVLCASFPKCLIVDVEFGTRSLRNHPELMARKIPILPLKTFGQVDLLLQEVRLGKWNHIDTIIIDSVSELQAKHLDEHLRKMAARDKSRSAYVPYQNDFNENTNHLRSVVTSLRDINTHNFILTALLDEYKEGQGDSAVTKYQPKLTDKLNKSVFALMDFVGFMSLDVDMKGAEKRKLQVRKSSRIRAKSRLAFESPIIENPTAEIILKANETRLDEETLRQIEEISPDQHELESELEKLKVPSETQSEI